MKSLPQVAWFLLTSCTVLFASAAPSGLSADGNGAINTVASGKELFQKTYKRRCTNSKCKQVSESTKSIFKCPFCGSSTVPMN